MSDYRNEHEATERMASQAMRPYWNRQQRPRTDWVRLILRACVVMTVIACAAGWWAGRAA